MNIDQPNRTMNGIIDELGPEVGRVQASHCVDMLTSETERERIAREMAGGESVQIPALGAGEPITMKVTIVYNNCLMNPGLRTGWGFSCLIEPGDAPPILFDTGADGATLMHTMKRLGIDPRRIKAIVISHAHGDQSGALSEMLQVNKIAEIYVPISTVARVPGRRVIQVSRPVEISEAFFSTGELGCIEQSLAVKTSEGVIVVADCSPPGIGLILDAASHHGRICGILGGLHGFHDFSRLEALSLICPCNCTRYIVLNSRLEVSKVKRLPSENMGV